MAQDKIPQEDDLEVINLDLDIDSNSQDSKRDDDQDSISRLIASTQKELFGPALKEAASAARRTRPWRPIAPTDTPASSARAGKGASFAAETIFHERTPTPPADTNRDCVVRMRFKLQPCDVQETLVGLLAHCLGVLQERDKTACILNG